MITMLLSSFIRQKRASQLQISLALWGGIAHAKSFSSKYLMREPPSSAPRLVPTPLVFVSASEWQAPNRFRDGFARMYPEKGFTCLDVDIPLPPESHITNDSGNLMKHFESELQSAIRLTMIPFAPIIFASGAGCLIAQTYVSSHPAKGLVLISPPPSNDAATLPTPLPEFNFEPKFPIVVVSTPQQMEVLRKEHRLLRDRDSGAGDVDTIVVDDVEGQDAFVGIEMWLDELGV